MRTNAPQQPAIDKAYLLAIKYSHWSFARYLCSLPVNAVSQKVIDESVIVVINSEDLQSVHEMCHMPECRPSLVAIERGVQQAVKLQNEDILRYLCSLDTTPPRPHVLEQVLQSIIKNKCLSPQQLSIVNYICSLVSPSIIERLIKFATKYGQTAVVKYCRELDPQNQKTIRDEIKTASSNGDERDDVFEPVDKKKSGGVVLPRSGETLPFGGIKKSVSCGALDIYGLFGYRPGGFRYASLSDSPDLLSTRTN